MHGTNRLAVSMGVCALACWALVGAARAGDKKLPEDPFGDAAPRAERTEKPRGDKPRKARKAKRAKAREATPGEPAEPKQLAPAEPVAPPPVAAPKRDRFGQAAVAEALDEPTELDFIDTGLDDVVAFIADAHDVHVVIDRKALDDVGIAPDVPVTVALRDIPLRDALNILLREVELTWVIRDGVLQITTPEVAETVLETRVYDVGDLLWAAADAEYDGRGLPTTPRPDVVEYEGGRRLGFDPRFAGGNPPQAANTLGSIGGTPNSPKPIGIHTAPRLVRFSMDDLIDLITTAVAPVTWDEVGGAGSVAPSGHLLVVNQTGDVHDRVAALFAELRKVRQDTPQLTIDARWLLLTPEQAEVFIGEDSLAMVDLAALDRLSTGLPAGCGRIGTLSGQSVHLASGIRQSVVTGANPVVDGTVAYQPVVEVINVGLLLEVRATVSPGSDQAEVQLAGTVTAEETGKPKAEVRTESLEITTIGPLCELDRPALRTEQWATTLRVPLGRPVLAGSVTRSPAADTSGQPRAELYLFLQVGRE